MSDQNYTASFTVDELPEKVFNSINNVRGWWSQAIEGDTDKPGAVFYTTGKGKPNPIEEIVTRARQMSRKAS